MTPEQQSRADHLALVAAPIVAAYLHDESVGQWPSKDIADLALNIAQRLQRAAEERVKRE